MANETVFKRYAGNPIVTASAVPGPTASHNSAIVKRGEGDYAGVFRVDEISMDFVLRVGFSRDGSAGTSTPSQFKCRATILRSSSPVTATTLALRFWKAPTISPGATPVPRARKSGLPLPRLQDLHPRRGPAAPANRNCVVFPRKINEKYAIFHRPSDRGHTPFGDISMRRALTSCIGAAIGSSSDRWRLAESENWPRSCAHRDR